MDVMLSRWESESNWAGPAVSLYMPQTSATKPISVVDRTYTNTACPFSSLCSWYWSSQLFYHVRLYKKFKIENKGFEQSVVRICELNLSSSVQLTAFMQRYNNAIKWTRSRNILSWKCLAQARFRPWHLNLPENKNQKYPAQVWVYTFG